MNRTKWDYYKKKKLSIPIYTTIQYYYIAKDIIVYTSAIIQICTKKMYTVQLIEILLLLFLKKKRNEEMKRYCVVERPSWIILKNIYPFFKFPFLSTLLKNISLIVAFNVSEITFHIPHKMCAVEKQIDVWNSLYSADFFFFVFVAMKFELGKFLHHKNEKEVVQSAA